MLGTAATARWSANRRPLSTLAGWGLVIAAAWLFGRSPSASLAFLVPALLVVGLVARRWPAATMITVFALSGAYGSAKAFLSVPANGIATALILGLAVAMLGSFVFGRRNRALVIWPGAALATLYLVLLVADIPFSPALSPAVKVARTAGIYMFAFLPIAYGPWRSSTHERMRRALVLISAAVGAYATLRWSIGASAKEKAQITSVLYNQTTIGQNKVQGSFPSGVELGSWTSMMIPFLLASLLTMRGRTRLVAFAGLPLCVIGLFGSGLRIGLVAAAVGCAIVMFAYTIGRGMPLARPAVTVGVLVALVAGGAVLFPAVIHDPNNVQRYRNILSPARDPSVQGRLDKWRQAVVDLRGHPFGFGLGTLGSESSGQRFLTNTNQSIDSGYLRIGYEQGLAVMALYIATLLVLLAGLLHRGLWSLDRARAGPAIAAAGTLAAFMVVMGADVITSAQCTMSAWIIVGAGMAPFTRLDPVTGRGDA
jgi:hypothetical protein